VKFLLAVWLLANTGFLGVPVRSDVTEFVAAVLSSGLGGLIGVLGLRRYGSHLPRASQLVARMVIVVVVFNTYACLYASFQWGGFAIGEFGRALSLGPFLYFATHPDQVRHTAFFRKCVRALALYFSVILIVYIVSGLSPPGYEPVVEGSPLEGLHLLPSTVLFTAIVLEFMDPSSIRWHWVLLFLFGQYVEGHASLFFAAVVVLIGLVLGRFLVPGIRGSPQRAQLVAWMLISAAGIAITGAYYAGAIEKVLESDALTSRRLINEQRIADWKANYWLGVGAPSRLSTIGAAYADSAVSRFRSTVRVVDYGYLDIALRFGVVFGALYMVLWGIAAMIQVRLVGSWRGLAFFATFLSFLFVNVTLSVFTIPDGWFALFSILWFSSRQRQRTTGTRQGAAGC
jgi:hypothetical protein